jgi:hypothetical protein
MFDGQIQIRIWDGWTDGWFALLCFLLYFSTLRLTPLTPLYSFTHTFPKFPTTTKTNQPSRHKHTYFMCLYISIQLECIHAFIHLFTSMNKIRIAPVLLLYAFQRRMSKPIFKSHSNLTSQHLNNSWISLG